MASTFDTILGCRLLCGFFFVQHYYSRVAYALQLLPALQRSPDPRVLSVFSAGVHKSYQVRSLLNGSVVFACDSSSAGSA